MGGKQAAARLCLRLAAALLLVLLFWLLGPLLWDSLSPFIIAVPIAAALQPPIRLTQKYLRLGAGASTLLWVLLVCAVATGLLLWFSSFLIAQLVGAAQNAQTLVGGVIDALKTAAERLMGLADPMSETVSAWLRQTMEQAFAWISETATRLAGGVLESTFNLAMSTPYALVYANFLILGIYFVAAGYPRLRALAAGKLGAGLRARAEVLLSTAGRALVGYLRVQIIFSLAVLVVTWLVLQAFGLQYALLLALLAALLEFLPLFGNGTLFIPWGILCVIIGQTTQGVMLIALNIGLTIFRRMAEPRIMSENMGLSPLLSLVGMFAGMRLAGVAGLVFGPVVMVMLRGAAQARLFEETKRDLRTVTARVRARLGVDAAHKKGAVP